MLLKVFSEKIDWGRKSHPEYRQHHTIDWERRWMKEEKEGLTSNMFS